MGWGHWASKDNCELDRGSCSHALRMKAEVKERMIMATKAINTKALTQMTYGHYESRNRKKRRIFF